MLNLTLHVSLVLVLGSLVFWAVQSKNANGGDKPWSIRRSVDFTVLKYEEDNATPAVKKAPAATPAKKNLAKPAAKAVINTAKPKAAAPKPAPKAKTTTAKPAPKKVASVAKKTAERMKIETISLSIEGDGSFKLHIRSDDKLGRVTWFRLPKTNKMVFDVHGAWTLIGAHVLRFGSGPIKHLVAGEHADKLRLVILYRDGHAIAAGKPVLRSDATGLIATVPAK